jgi:hypothetical protein
MTGLAALPPDDGIREPSVVEPEDEALTHVAIGDGTYTILVRGEDTGDRYALIDMVIPLAAGRPRTVTTSRRCSMSSRVRST